MVEVFREKLSTEALSARVERMVAALEKAAGEPDGAAGER
jgi:hypothetical protein